MPQYLTTAEVADLCRSRPETVRYWRHIGYGPPSFRVGRRVLYEAVKVRDWIGALANESR
jgi:DNA-binding transcriptional MerR regulator